MYAFQSEYVLYSCLNVKKLLDRNRRVETSQLICIANQLAGFYTVRVFIEKCFQKDYKFNSNYNFMQL